MIVESHWKSEPKRVRSPVDEIVRTLSEKSTARQVEPCRNKGGPSPKAKYSLVTDSEPVP